MIKLFCDRCGEEIEGDVYYLKFQPESIVRTGFCTSPLKAELCNSYAVNPVTEPQRMYCRGCRDDILEYAKSSAMNNTNVEECEPQIVTEEEKLGQECRKSSNEADELCKKMREAIPKSMSQLEEKGVFDNLKKFKNI